MNLGQKIYPADRVFGVRIEPNEWNAGKCINGQPNSHEVRPDDDLGHTNKFGWRNQPKQGDETRVFGVSTIRYDIPKPKQQSVADPNVMNVLYRIMLMKQPQLSYYSLKTTLAQVLELMTSNKQEANKT